MNEMDYFAKFMREKMGISADAKSGFGANINFKAVEWSDALIPEIEISAHDENLSWTDKGIFYNGRRVILYIRDQAGYYVEGSTSGYKFHVTGCSTLKSMHTQHRYDKYVISTNTNGIFKVNRIVDYIPTEIEVRLHVCKHCLRMLNWKNYKNRPPSAQTQIYENFSIEEFFKSVDKGIHRQDFFIGTGNC